MLFESANIASNKYQTMKKVGICNNLSYSLETGNVNLILARNACNISGWEHLGNIWSKISFGDSGKIEVNNFESFVVVD